jgi:hypothetical protein
MAGEIHIDGYEDMVVNICPLSTRGQVIEIDGLLIQLPSQPPKEDILHHDKEKKDQRWQRQTPPEPIRNIRSMDEWSEQPKETQKKYIKYIEREFKRRNEGLWFYNNGEATYMTGDHYMLLQWSKIDGSFYGDYLAFQRTLYIHALACEVDSRCVGQLYTKCRRSGYTNMACSRTLNQATQTKDKMLGIMSKTGKDAQENVFMNKVVRMYRNYPFFFKPIQDGSTNPRIELAFREPSQRITKNYKTSSAGKALNTIINWRTTTNNAYDGERLHLLFIDEAGKFEKPADIRETWRIHRTCLIVGKKIVGTAMIGSTVNPMDKGGNGYKKLWMDSDPSERNANGRTKSMLYRLFVPAYNALEGFFDMYGAPVIDDPESPVMGIDGEEIVIGARTYLNNERVALKDDSRELNEVVRQFPFSSTEAFRDSVETSLFNLGKIYEQIQYNEMIYPNPVVKGNFHWKNGEVDTDIVFAPSADGRWHIAWIPPEDYRNNKGRGKTGGVSPGNANLGVGGCDSYDLDATVDGRGSKGACHFYNKFSMNQASNMFVAEYAERPPLAKIFYEDVLMAAVFFGYPVLIENNKYGIARYFEQRGYVNYLLDRPEHLGSAMSKSKTKGVPSNSSEMIQAHAMAIEAFIHTHVGETKDGGFGKMYLDRTLEDWVGFKITNRTKYDLSISSGLCLLAAQVKTEKKKSTDFSGKKFFRSQKHWSREDF